jgi:hypothetical protein
MYRTGALASISTLMLLVACGSDTGAPSHGWPSAGNDSAGSDPGAIGNGAGSATTPSAGSGDNVAGSNAAQSGSASGGSASGGSAGSDNDVAGSGGTATAGGAPVAGNNAGGVPATSNEYWIAPNGADTNPGTETAPFATVLAALTRVKPGVTLWLKPGTYASAATISILFKYSGTEAQPVTLKAAPGARPVLDFSQQQPGNDDLRGINLLANYWNIQGIEIKKAGDNCIAIAGSNNTIEDVIVHECGDTGIQITAPSDQAADDTRAANNTILNCDSWGNLDSATGGENADGFAAKLRIGPGNVFKGCRAWNNADDGWDLFAADDVVKIDSSWAFSNGKPLGGSNPQGDGNGFKLGGAPDGPGQGGAVHLVSGSFAFENKSCGFVRNNNPDVPKLSACGAKDNKTAYCSLSVSGEIGMTMSSTAARTAARNADGSLPAMK